MSKKILILVLGLIFAINLIFFFNKMYTIRTDNGIILNNVSEFEYNKFMINDSDLTSFYDKNTSIKYFGIFPEWSFYIIYFSYLIVGYNFIQLEEKERNKIPIAKPEKFSSYIYRND